MFSYLPPTKYPAGKLNASLSEQSDIQSYTEKRNDFCRQLDKFKTDVKTYFLSESLTKLLKDSLPENVDESYINVGKNMINKFIADEGVDRLLSRFSQTSVFLAEMANIVNESYTEVMEKCDTDSCDVSDLYVMPSSHQKFFDRLNGFDTEKMSTAIAQRVSDAEQEFIMSNVEDRKKMEEAAEKTKEKIDNFVGRTKEVTEAVREEYQRDYKRQIHDLSNRRRGILEAMVLKAGSKIMKSDDMRKEFTTESGKFDADKTIDTCEVLYTVLEMINTAKMRPVNAEYVQLIIDGV